MWGLGKEQVATSRRREADGSLSPCVKGTDGYSGTGERQERCLSAVESTALDCKQTCHVMGEQFQTILSDGAVSPSQLNRGCFVGLLYFYTTKLGVFTPL